MGVGYWLVVFEGVGATSVSHRMSVRGAAVWERTLQTLSLESYSSDARPVNESTVDSLAIETTPAFGDTLSQADQPKPSFENDASRSATNIGFDDALRIASFDSELKRSAVDSLEIPPSDSTARATFLPDRPKSGPVATPFPERISPIYLQPSGGRGIQRIIKVDSARNVVLIREVVNGKDIRVPLEMSLDEYIRKRYEYERDRRTHEYVTKQKTGTGDDLTNIFGRLTEFDIPIPPNPLMSIFGDRSRISLRISGAIDINAGFRIESSDQQSVFLNQTQFSPNFRQQVQVNVNGLIGDKLSIRADWSTERTFDYENQLKIKYTGYEDEVVQSVEAGNVSLQTPSTLVGGSGALFGIKAEFLVGPLRLSTVASQKKGEANRLTVSGGSTEQKFERRAYDYSDNHYFVNLDYREPQSPADLRTVYESYYNYRAENRTAPLQLRPDLYIKDIEVWITRPASAGVVTDPEERKGIALIDLLPNVHLYQQSDPQYPDSLRVLIDPNNKLESQSGLVEVGNFKRLKKDVDYSYNPVTGILTMNQNVQDDQVIAAAYRIENGSGPEDDIFFGTFVNDPRFTAQTDPRLVLKLVKPKNLSPSFKKAWKHKVRSIYSLNMRNMKAEDLANFKIIYREGGQSDLDNLPDISIPLLRLFGVDYTNESGPPPDGKIDFLPGLTVDPVRGEIIFPTLEPWNSGLRSIYLTFPNTDPAKIEPFLFPEVYDTTKTIARQSQRDKILIVGTTRGTSSAVYNLGFNVVPGSVRVLLNGQPMTKGPDYTVDELSGQVRILKEEALIPGAKVDIDYERQDLFSFASKTLLGVRGEAALGKETFLGFTLLTLNQQTLSDKVRIGEEPINNTMFGFDARTRLDVPFITDALNTLPFIQTKEKSTLTIQGEGAMMIPDPNTKKSTIPTDNELGIAYIDDFEGSRMFIPLQTAYSVWRLASVPATLPTFAAANDSMMNSRRAKLNWFNLPISAPSSRTVVVTDIWPDRLAAREDQRVTVLDLEFDPARRGQFNYTPQLSNPRENWAGMIRLLPVNATNLVDGNYNYIELWMKVESFQPQAKLLIDLGKVSEDVIPNGTLNSEDLVNPASIRNGILNPGEDIGLDMLTDAEEKIAFANEITLYNLDPNDPSGDNFVYNASNWDQFNGTQGNIDDPAGQFPDTEDLNNNGVLDLTNDYFQYEIDLDSTKFSFSVDPTQRNPYVVGGGTNGWYQFRIPLSQFKTTEGSPALDNVEFLRMLVTGADGALNIRIAEFNFTGNQWYERTRNDSLFNVSVVNIEDNPDYTSPPGVIRERDRRRPDQEVFGNEQSLALVFRNLPDTTIREAYRQFPNGIDLFNYESMKMYVHGDPQLANEPYEIVMRFGIDTLNYYEYRSPVYPGWDFRNEVSIRFSDLTAVKTQRDSCNESADIPVPGGQPGAVFKVKGCPDIVSVRFISAGVRNLNTTNRPITGQVWLNELRVVGPDERNGVAYMGSVNLRLADIADINANINYSDPFFHTLAERFSSTRSYTTNWNMSTTLNIDKAFPKEWQGTQLRITYSHAENLRKPLLLPGQPDVDVEGSIRILIEQMRAAGAPQHEIDLAVRDARFATQTLEIRDSWAIPTVRLKAPGESWLVQNFVNRLELSFNYSIIRFRDPVLQGKREWQWTARTAYSFDFGREGYIQPFKNLFSGVFLLDHYRDFKIYYLPSRFGASADMQRSRTEEQHRDPRQERPYIRGFTHTRSMNLAHTLSENGLLNISGTYNATMNTSLLHFETEYILDENGDPVLDFLGNPVVRQRRSSEIFNDIFFGRGGNLNLGIPMRYTQQVAINSRPRIPNLFNIDRYADLSASYTVNYYWQENLQQAGLGRTAGYNASSNLQLNVKIKSLFDPLFESPSSESEQTPERTGMPGRRRVETEADRAKRDLRERQMELQKLSEQMQKANPKEAARLKEQYMQEDQEIQRLMQQLSQPDTTGAAPPTDSLKIEFEPSGPSIGEIFGKLAYWLIKIPFLEYENVGISFAQTNASTVSGVRGETGFGTFWTSPIWSNPANADRGPSRLYQLGLVSDPNPSSGTLAFRRTFPFVGIDGYERGLRAANPNGTYTDNFTQSNTFSVRTNRPLWEGARIDLDWNLRWSSNKNTQLRTDSLGQATITSVTATGQFERSYMTFPDFLFFSYFNTNVGNVNERYQQLLNDPSDRRTNSEKLAEAFEEGFEAVPWLTKVLSGFFPRVNWSVRWDGIEKIGLISGFADRISFEHRYTSTLTSSHRLNQDDGSQITENKRVGYNFAPLIGLNFGFNRIWNGDLNVTSRWGTQKTFDLNTSSNNIVETESNEITLTANFRKAGFELPLFGLNLKNDIDFSFSFSLNKTNSRTYDINALDSEGQPREGTTRITIEPRVRYVISQRVTSSLFYRYQRTKPDTSVGSRIPGTTVHEGGLEIRISITGN